jgi:hypothetical protein
MGFAIASTGAAAARNVVRWVSNVEDGNFPWALVGAPLASMLSEEDGTAWIEYVLAEGDGIVHVLVARESLDTDRAIWFQEKCGVACYMADGELCLHGVSIRARIPCWGPPMSAGEVVRLVYVRVTRMISVVWRGQSLDLCALPVSYSVADARFGVVVSSGNAVRITGASSAGACA